MADSKQIIRMAMEREEFLRDDSGTIYYWPIGAQCGAYRAHDLRVIADELDRLNGDKTHGCAVKSMGCHLELDPGMEPDDCVINEGRHADCFYAKEGMTPSDCQFWLPVKRKR